jgi:hypothetical protein
MKVKYVKCDHCGKKLNEMSDYIDMIILECGNIRTDICERCYYELKSMIKDFCRTDVVKESEESEE